MVQGDVAAAMREGIFRVLQIEVSHGPMDWIRYAWGPCETTCVVVVLLAVATASATAFGGGALDAVQTSASGAGPALRMRLGYSGSDLSMPEVATALPLSFSPSLPLLLP